MIALVAALVSSPPSVPPQAAVRERQAEEAAREADAQQLVVDEIVSAGVEIDDAALERSAKHFCGTYEACADGFRRARDTLVYERFSSAKRKQIIEALHANTADGYTNWGFVGLRFIEVPSRPSGTPRIGVTTTCRSYRSANRITSTCSTY